MNMGEEQECAAIVAVLLADEEESRKRRKKRFWTKRWFLRRETHSDFQLVQELRENNPDDFRNYLRMDDRCFKMLLALVDPIIRKQDTLMRKAIPPEQRLIAALRYLATGRSLEDMKFSTRISPQRLGFIIAETCEAIIKVLTPKYMKFPKKKEDWQKIAEDFFESWNFPNCGGAMDGKHIRIVAPAGEGSYYYNYKGYHSIVLMAIVNAKYEFIMADVGTNGRISDGGVMEDTAFHKKLMNKSLNLPSSGETAEGLNFVFIGDDAFALHENVLKPFPQRLLDNEAKKIYNYRTSRARRCVENAFGIMSSRFRIFHTAIDLSIWKIDLVVMACCVLHNFLRNENGQDYISSGSVDNEDVTAGVVTPGLWRNEGIAYHGLQELGRNNSLAATENRERYVQYFNGAGAVEWQYAMI